MCDDMRKFFYLEGIRIGLVDWWRNKGGDIVGFLRKC